MNEGSPRLETQARRVPFGAHCRAPAAPRAKKKRVAGVEPSIGTDQIARSLMNATRSPLGEMTGSSPSLRSFAPPPANGMVQSCTFICVGAIAGFTPVELSQFEP